ncbi:MAG: hypothetical protein JO020_02565 [Chloroflexi bacterium]|nr:hypothetical protein [Chloroflexota bacterium]MBV9893033.1 hypothetical protein [Chloroflexota bacterium]
MRVVLTGLLASVILGTSAVGLSPHARELLTGIFQDVGSILNSFTGGPDDPHSPVTNSVTLKQDSARFDSATQKAQQLATELGKLDRQTSDRGH